MSQRPTGEFVEIDGTTCYRINDVDAMAPFLVSLVSHADVWAFITSNGGITAGRRGPDHAVFPYRTEDQLVDNAGTTGGTTRVVATDRSGRHVRWEPFGPCHPQVRRSMAKSVLGTVVAFQEHHPGLGLTWRARWRVSPTHGLVRSVTIESHRPDPVELEITDGLRNILPPEIGARTQRELSVLLDAYKVTECDPDSGVAWVRLNSRLTDKAEASEALGVTVMWQVGLDDAEVALSETDLQPWASTDPGRARQVRGERAAYLLRATRRLDPGGRLDWSVVVDTDRDVTDVVAIVESATDRDRMARELEADIAAGADRLGDLVAAADGVQRSDDPMTDAHHAASTMFNLMRGGVPVAGHEVEIADVVDFVSERNAPVAQRWSSRLADLGPIRPIGQVIEAAAQTADPDLTRLVGEYLPLTFSRRHGDPSRPWNAFDIVLADEHDRPRLSHEGNWRDIFQNWEALAHSFPELTESMIRTFVNATTLDGYNPYRIGRAGIDWEVPEEDDPWSNIGYWSDHQIVYLHRLLLVSRDQHPDRLAAMLPLRTSVHADVPYTLAGYEQTVADPHDTVTFDARRHEAARARMASVGADGALVPDPTDPEGRPLRATLMEKLLLLLGAKLANFVPDGGIWMNTQRPEWNDANNALVGNGLSVVTIAQLAPYVDLLVDLLGTMDRAEPGPGSQGGQVEMSAPLRDLLVAATDELARHEPPVGQRLDGGQRRQMLDVLGSAGSAYRMATVRDGRVTDEAAQRATMPARALEDRLAVVRAWLAATVRGARRDDGLYDSYRVLHLPPGRAEVQQLAPMLEGQVAVLASGVLTPAESVTLLRTLRASDLFRSDVHSYQLYPEPSVPTLLQRNTIPAARVADSRLLTEQVERGHGRLVVADARGAVHFAASIRNADDVQALLDDLGAAPSERTLVLDIFDDTFGHRAFTGRSSSFFAYEGVGSVYWHMVSKLLLAVGELIVRARSESADAQTLAHLQRAYDDIRDGLGYRRTPAAYGAFPADPYSHTPAGRGARQPGMTGQVKEDILARRLELGVSTRDGRLVLDPSAVAADQWCAEAGVLDYVDVAGDQRQLPVPAGAVGFTVAGVPVVYRRRGDGQSASAPTGLSVVVTDPTGGRHALVCSGGRLPEWVSTSVLSRDGGVAAIHVGP